MTSRRLLILVALAAIAIAGALVLSRQQAATTAGDRDQLLYPQLKTQLDTVDSIRVFKAGDARVVEVKRNGADWSVEDRGGYPADAAKVRKFLIATADAKLVEEKTSNPANYPAIGVEDLAAPGATGHRIEIGGAIPVNLIVGKQAPGARSQYVRRVGDQPSWQIGDSLDVPTTVDAWLRKDIIDVTSDRIQFAQITTAGGKPYTASKMKREDANFTVDGLPKGKELSSPSAANALASALGVLTLADVKKVQELQADKPAAHATFKTFDGLAVDVDGWVKDDKHYIAVMPAYDDALAQRFKVAAADEKSAGEQKAAAPTATSPARDVAAEAKTQAAQLNGWAFEIPEYKYEAIFKPLDELLKK